MPGARPDLEEGGKSGRIPHGNGADLDKLNEAGPKPGKQGLPEDAIGTAKTKATQEVDRRLDPIKEEVKDQANALVQQQKDRAPQYAKDQAEQVGEQIQAHVLVDPAQVELSEVKLESVDKRIGDLNIQIEAGDKVKLQK